MHLTFKNTVQLLKPAVIDYYFITGLEFRKRFYKTICSDSRSNQADDLLINRRWPVVETHQAVDSTGESYFVIEVVESKTRKDITGEQWLNDTTQLSSELVALINKQLRIQSFQSPCLQVAAGALLLFVVSTNNIPVNSVFILS